MEPNRSHPGDQRDPEFIRSSMPIVERYVSWFKPTVRGFEHLPAKGPFLVVGNHSGGQTPPDLPILMTAWWRERGVDEPVYGLFHSTMINMPIVGPWAVKAGALEAGHNVSEAVLRDGGIVIVYPGGDREVFRPWTERNQVDFGGRSGFIRLALRMGIPVVPCVSSGAHESLIVLSRGEQLAALNPLSKVLRTKVMPIVLGPPWGITMGLPTIPLPTRVITELCPTLHWEQEYGPEAADDDAVVEKLYDQIHQVMQAKMDQLVLEREAETAAHRAERAARRRRS